MKLIRKVVHFMSENLGQIPYILPMKKEVAD